MPGKMQTEYMRNFKWTNRPIRFKPATASLDPRRGVCEPRRAGLASSTIGIHREPSIQIKNRSASPALQPSAAEPKHRSSSYHHPRRSRQDLHASSAALSDPLYRPVPAIITSARSDDAPPAGRPTWKNPRDPTSAIADDFVLLGSQSKFAPNVAYRLRKPIDPARMQQLPPQPATAQLVEHDTQTADAEIKIASPPVAHFYTADENIQVTEADLPEEALTPPPSPPDAPRPEPVAVTEGVQTDVDENYAIRQRLGLVSRVNAGRFQTEYGRQYNPPHSVSAPAFRRHPPKLESPLVNADVMFRRSRSRSPVGAMPPSLLQTEYKRNFKPYQWQLHQQSPRRCLSAEGHEILYEAEVPNRSPIPPSALKAAAEHDKSKRQVIKKVKEGKPKRFTSEYMSNFRPPSAFLYEDGTWKGGNQPQMILSNSAPQAVVPGDPSWLTEVRELKTRAKEYQVRSKGTHFSSTHVGQLYSDKARLWDQPAGDGGTRMAMLDASVPEKFGYEPREEDVAEVATDYVQVNTLPSPEDFIPTAGLPTVRRGNVRQSLEWAVHSPDSTPANSESECASAAEEVQYIEPEPQIVEPVHLPVNDIPPRTGRSEESSNSSDSVLPTAAGGRVRTSRMAVLQSHGNGSPRRHHLDVTTPAVGGALLVSPPIREKKSISARRNRSSHDDSGRAAASSGYSSAAPSRPLSPPAYGKPTPDSHLIVDRDKPVSFTYVRAPKKKGQQASTRATEVRPAAGTVEQLILERSRENAPLVTSAPARKATSRSKPSAPLSATQPVAASRLNTKGSHRSAGLTISIPDSSSNTVKVIKPSANALKQSKAHDVPSPPSRASSATYSAASDVLEKARARANFWDKSATAKV